MYGYIYKTTNLINNKIYIGQHKSKVFDTKYYGSGKILKNAIKKYGIDNFKVEIVKECYSKEELDENEIYYISYYRNINECYNITSGGYGLRDYVFTEEDKLKISKASTQHNLNRDRCIYDKVSIHHYGSKMMNNGKIQKWVFKDDIDYYLSTGWKFGSCDKRKREYKLDNNPFYKNSFVKGRKWIHKYINNKLERLYVYENNLNTYINDGWLLGMK